MGIHHTAAAKNRDAREAARRADIVGRYVALGVPTVDDDARYAAKLGLKPDTLIRLARNWRLHGEARALHGAYTEITEQDRIDAIAATIAPDLTGVNPTRREDTLRRIEAVARYLAILTPTQEDMLQIAASVGLEEQGFRQLLRNWLLHRSAKALPAARRPLTVPQRKRPKMGHLVEELIAQAIAEFPVDVPAHRVHRRVASMCRDAGLKPPTSSTIYYRMMNARAGAPDTADPHICVDHSALMLAVAGPAGPQVPVLSIVFARPRGRILAHSLSLQPPSPRATSALLAEVVGLDLHPGSMNGRLDIGFDGDSWSGLAATLANSGVVIVDPERTFKPGKAIGQAIGNIIGNLRTCPRFTRAPVTLPKKAVSADQPFSFDQAVAIVDDAIALHNDGRPVPALTFVAAENATALADHLHLAADPAPA